MKNQINPKIMEQISLNNYEVLHKQLLRLSWEEQIAIQLRFWEKCSICQVAHILGVNWEEADDLIETAISNLKIGLLKSLTQN